MKQIKTIRTRIDDAGLFDDAVNEAIEDGWALKKRKTLIPKAQNENEYTHILLYAELEINVETEEETETNE